MTSKTGILLKFSDSRPSLTDLEKINAILGEIGSGAWPLDLSGSPDHIQRLLRQPTLIETETEQVRRHFLLPRKRLLEVIAAAGRQPNVLGGGELTTFVSNYGYSYPQLLIVQGNEDFSRFDRFHVNVSEEGIGVDEVAQLLWGGGLVIRHRLSTGVILTINVDCPSELSGWLVTHDGSKPHIGSFSQAAPGTKCLVQVIGPAQWIMHYEDKQ
jgi:hypothetical protein